MVGIKRIRTFMKECRSGFHLFGESLATVINSILLTIVYIIGVGLTALLMLRKRNNLLDKDINPETESYWKDVPQNEKELDYSYKQF